jgi:hypothetical protein
MLDFKRERAGIAAGGHVEGLETDDAVAAREPHRSLVALRELSLRLRQHSTASGMVASPRTSAFRMVVRTLF